MHLVEFFYSRDFEAQFSTKFSYRMESTYTQVTVFLFLQISQLLHIDNLVLLTKKTSHPSRKKNKSTFGSICFSETMTDDIHPKIQKYEEYINEVLKKAVLSVTHQQQKVNTDIIQGGAR